MCSRPKSKYAQWEEPLQEGEPFDYDAVPNRFYFEVEASGTMEPDLIIQGGIRVLQQKIGGLLKGLDPRKYGGDDTDMDGPRSPDMNMDGGTTPWQDGGYTTPYGNNTAYGGGNTAYGGGTSYGGSATAYGNGTAYGGSSTSYGGSAAGGSNAGYGSGPYSQGNSWQ